jgi:hypothetical protein
VRVLLQSKVSTVPHLDKKKHLREKKKLEKADKSKP